MTQIFKSPFGIPEQGQIDFSLDSTDPPATQQLFIPTGQSQQSVKSSFQGPQSQPFSQNLTGNISMNSKEMIISDISGNIIDEPPLLEDLGIDIDYIKSKTVSVLLLKKSNQEFIDEPEMLLVFFYQQVHYRCGPIIFLLVFGFCLMLSGKMNFGYIYGFSILGTFGVYAIMNFLSQNKYLELYHTISILGYGILPVVLLSALGIILSLKSSIGVIFTISAIAWATYSASTFFQEVNSNFRRLIIQIIDLPDRKWLIAYPVCLFYSTFILITIF